MNKKGIIKSGMECDAVYNARYYCYLVNHPSNRRYAKDCLRRRLRREGKEYIRNREWEV